VEYVRYKRPTLDEGRVSFSWVELTNDENVTSMFWEHNMFQWIYHLGKTNFASFYPKNFLPWVKRLFLGV
jgi:hypothetical protein